MEIPCDSLVLIRDKDGVSVWRVKAGGSSVVLICFEKPGYRFKSYAYSGIRNVCGNFYNAEAKAAFLSAYGAFNEHEKIVDNAASVLSALITAGGRKVFPDWAKGLLEEVKDGRLLDAVETLPSEPQK